MCFYCIQIILTETTFIDIEYIKCTGGTYLKRKKEKNNNKTRYRHTIKTH